MPPAFGNASRRTSMQPPAAAAVRGADRSTQENGYSIWKKNMKAGTNMRSARLWQRNFDHQGCQHVAAGLSARHQLRSASGR